MNINNHPLIEENALLSLLPALEFIGRTAADCNPVTIVAIKLNGSNPVIQKTISKNQSWKN